MAYLRDEQLIGQWVERPFLDPIDSLVLRDARYGAHFFRFVADQEWHHWVRPGEYVTIDQAARLLDVSSQLVDRLWRRGDLTQHHATSNGARLLALAEVRALHLERSRKAR